MTQDTYSNVLYIHTYVCYVRTYVTGFWKTGQSVTLGRFYFIGPVNGYTGTLQLHSTITGLIGWLIS